ncbi:reverse transcriptase family protein [Burkholderia cenocepacia]|uniref:reverse transcriptase family protein n=1 Tax=Burkholderia cenocepacia TaxID=95486 RepID=UPI002AB7ED7B|nr:reverse transcriptase family protein [Burkholderia cenocepacia]
MTILSLFSATMNLWEIEDFSTQILGGILADSEKYYRSFQLPKRKGGMREINSPYPVLAQIQQALTKYLRDQCFVSEHAYAYCRGRNAVMHATSHLGCDELLTVDIHDFFGSITRQQIHQSLLKNSIDANYSHIISVLATRKGILPQGAPTSPLLSNIVFSPLDLRFSRLAIKLGINYSRYADDLAFSGPRIPRNLPKLVEKILSEKNYRLNPQKTTLKIKGAKKIITGVSISGGTPKPPRKFVRSVRAEVYQVEKNINTLSSLSKIDPLSYERVLGKLNYWLQIEPHNKYALDKKNLISEAHQNFLNLSSSFDRNEYLQQLI